MDLLGGWAHVQLPTLPSAPSRRHDVVAGGLHSQDEGSALLREDDSLLRHTFFSILRHHHPAIASKASPHPRLQYHIITLQMCQVFRAGYDTQALNSALRTGGSNILSEPAERNIQFEGRLPDSGEVRTQIWSA